MPSEVIGNHVIMELSKRGDNAMKKNIVKIFTVNIFYYCRYQTVACYCGKYRAYYVCAIRIIKPRYFI